MRLSDQISAFINTLNADSKCFFASMQQLSFVVSGLCPEIEIHLILQPIYVQDDTETARPTFDLAEETTDVSGG